MKRGHAALAVTAAALAVVGCGRWREVAETPVTAHFLPQADAKGARRSAPASPAARVEKGFVIQVWSAESGRRRLTRFLPARGAENAPAPVVSPDGRKMAATDGPGVRIIDLNSGKRRTRIAKSGYRLAPERFAAGGGRLVVAARPAAGASERFLYALDGRQICALPEGELLYAPDGQKAATAVSDDTGVHVRVLDLRTGREMVRSHAAYDTPNDVKAYVLTNDTLAALYHYAGGAPDNWVGLWNPKTRAFRVIRFSTGGYHHQIALDGKRLATLGDDGSGTLWDTAKEQLLARFRQDSVRVSPISPAGLKATVTLPSGKRRVFTDVSSWAALAALEGEPLLAGGRRLVQSRPGRVELWDVAARKRLAAIPLPPATTATLALSSEGETLVLVYEGHADRLRRHAFGFLSLLPGAASHGKSVR